MDDFDEIFDEDEVLDCSLLEEIGKEDGKVTNSGCLGTLIIFITVLIVLTLFTATVVLNADEILLKNGRTINVKSYWEQNGEIIYYKHSINVHLDKNEIEKIINENGEVYVPKNEKQKRDNTAPSHETQEKGDEFVIEMYNHAIELYNQQKYEEAIGFFSICITSGYDLINSYLYRGSALYQRAQKLDENDKNKLEMAEYAKSDFDKAISNGETTGFAYINRAKVKWLIFSENESSKNDLETVIKGNFPLSDMAYYWRGLQEKSLNNDDEARQFMNKSANLGYKEALQILFENPRWPNKKD
ncbi:tetratricopeptide repeat protein [Desulfobacterales bacterium HSG17]|nr:tetratricopeptide repeat protein [Desulfobacterales bacterium HSG17]